MLCWASLFITLSSKAQTTLDYTTGNIVLPTVQGSNTTPWTNGVYQNSLTCWAYGDPGYCGPNGIVRPGNNINFSYGSSYLYQQQNVANLLPANAVNVTGYQFGFTAKNGNGWDNGMTDQLTALVRFWDNTGGRGATNLLYGKSWDLSQKYNWTNFNYNETLPNPLSVASIGQVQYGFIGKDNNGWAGPYGPEVYNISFSLKYSVDPCKLNAAYSPSCTGFNNIVESNNLLNSNVWAQSMYQVAAINTALQNGGIGAQVHGMKYSFDWYVGSDQCTSMFLFWCDGWTNSNVGVNVKMTAANGSALLNRDYGFSGYYQGGHVEGKMLLPSTLNQTALGTVSMSSWGWGDSSAGNFSTQLIYTPDPCVSNPLYSTSCSGYAVAYAKNMILGSTVASASGPIVSSGSTSLSTNTGTIEPMTTSSTGTMDPNQQTQQTTTSSPPPPGPAPAQETTTAQSDPAQPSPTQAGPAPTSPQPAGGPLQTASSSQQQQGGSSSGPSSLAMSVLKTAQDKDKATQAAAVQNAAKSLEASMQSSQAASNSAITMNQDMSANSATAAATFASQSTQASVQASQQIMQSMPGAQQYTAQTQQTSRATVQVQQQQQQDVQQAQVQQSTGSVQIQAPQQQQDTQPAQPQSASTIQQAVYTPPQQAQPETQSTQVTMLKPPAPAQIEVQQQASSGTGLTLSRNPFAYNPLGSINTSNLAMMQPQPAPTFQFRNEAKAIEVEAPQMQVATFGGVGKAGNPLSEMMTQQRFEMMQNNITQPASSVNKNVQPNDLAGGVDLTAMATVPVGFNAYSFVLKDAAFYEPKEVYKNQKTVDNARVLRGLTGGSDALHQRMVDSQYNRGN